MCLRCVGIDKLYLIRSIGIDNDIADFIDHHVVELQQGDGIVHYTDNK